MELWIRSQSKQTLMKVSKVYNQEEEIFATGYTEFDERIGVYATEERALEVLDEIQGTIINNEITNLIIPNVKDIKCNEEAYKKNVFSKMVYEMPKE